MVLSFSTLCFLGYLVMYFSVPFGWYSLWTKLMQFSELKKKGLYNYVHAIFIFFHKDHIKLLLTPQVNLLYYIFVVDIILRCSTKSDEGVGAIRTIL